MRKIHLEGGPVEYVYGPYRPSYTDDTICYLDDQLYHFLTWLPKAVQSGVITFEEAQVAEMSVLHAQSFIHDSEDNTLKPWSEVMF
jgi:hypothetical protein